ncbi:MAG: phosphomannomutase/phosphoglucomutase [Xanthomonadaceae bacterium]|nr:phosphomannomutase/phosphoglucomutase [Xanthomonadaceae bacterium]
MSAKNIKLPKLSLQPGSINSVRPLLAIGAGLLALWFLWAAINQWRASAATTALAGQRDEVAQKVGQVFAQAKKRVADAAAAPAVATAAAGSDPAAVQAAFASAAKGAQDTQLFPANLQTAYAGLPATGYGKLAVVEAVIASGKPQVQVARAGKGNALVAAAPLPRGQVALAVYPLQPLQAALAAAKPGNGYLALRQGNTTVAEKGDVALADNAESQGSKVPGTNLRVAAATPSVSAGPFGLGGLASLIVGLLLLAAAGVAMAWPKLRRRGPQVEGEVAAPTLEEAVAIEAAAAPPPVVPDSVPLAATGGDMPPPPVLDDDLPLRAPMPLAEVTAVDAGIFRAYDIRGVVGQTLNTDVAYAIGQAIGTLMHEKGLQRIVVGRDGRLSGPELAGALIEGLRSTGRDVIDIGLAPTPLVYFAAAQEEGGSCVAVTGSHNPPDYNGFKIVVGGETLSGETITDLYQRIVGGRLHRATQPGQMETRQMAPDYVLRVASDIQLARPLKVVVDAGNGAAGDLGPRVLEAIGAEVIPLFCEIDGTFPNHHPDPSEPHNLEDLRRSVEEHGADIGLAFDGDGDRLGVITPSGANIFPDRLLMLFAADVLDRQPGAVIVYDVKCSGALMPFILRHGGSPLMWKTGHSLIKAKMRETEAELAGEMSGHFFFKERWFGFDDGIYSAARLLEILAARDEDADAVFAEIPEGVSTPELKIPTPDPHAFIQRFVALGDFEGARATTIDGLRADWPDGWGLVRASNTTPILVLRFEADDEAALARIQEVFRARLLELDPDLSLPF